MSKPRIEIAGWIIFIFLSCAVFGYINACGLGYTTDSEIYLRIAVEIQNQGFWSAEGFQIKPPAYPLLLAWVGAKHIMVLQWTLFLFTLLLLSLLGKTLPSSSARWSFLLLISVTTPIYLVFAFAWTEPLFIPFLLSTFIAWERSQRSKTWLIVTLIFLFLLPFIRFAGLFVLIPGLTLILLQQWQKRLIWVLPLVLLGSAVVAIWAYRYADGFTDRLDTLIHPFYSLSGERLLINAQSFLKGHSLLVFPLSLPAIFQVTSGIFLLVLWLYFTFRSIARSIPAGFDAIPFIFVLYYLALHFVFEITYFTAERYLTPFYPLLLFFIVRNFQEKFDTYSFSFRTMLLLFWFYFLAYQSVRTAKNASFWHDSRCETKVSAPVKFKENTQPRGIFNGKISREIVSSLR